MRVAICLALMAGTAAADPCDDAKALVAKKDLVHAALVAQKCDDDAFAKTLGKQLLASNLGSVEMVSSPPGLILEIDALPGEKIELPVTLWLPPGAYTARVAVDGAVLTNAIEVKAHSRGTSIFNAPPKVVAKDEPKKVDFADEGGAGEAIEQTTAPPPDQKHPPLTPEKYRGISTASGPQIEDPLANGIPEAPRGPRAWSIGGRLGGGMFERDRVGGSIAAVGRYAIASDDVLHGAFLDARVDWSRRGAASIDTLGATAAIGWSFAQLSIGTLAATIGPRLDARLEGMSRVGASGTAGIDLAVAGAPISVGARVELGLTSPHDDTVIVEVGLDWR